MASAATPSSRLDQALADIAAITAEARKKPAPSAAGAGAPGTPSPLASVAADIRPAPRDSPDAALLRQTNRELNDALPGAELARLAQLCSTGSRHAERDVLRASMLWVLAANKGHAPSILTVGIASMDGFGRIPRDEARSFGILSQICEKSPQPWAHFAFATLLLRRHLAPEPLPSASAASAGAAAGRAAPVLDVARISEAKRDHPDCARALSSYRTAADGGLAPAWLNVANCLAYGVGLAGGEPQPDEAAKWLRLAAERGDPMAAAQYAHALTTGGAGGLYAIGEDLTAAAVWWRSAAVAGHPGAAHNLGVCYMRGTAPGCVGGKPDPAAALVWFRRAGEAGVVRAAMNAGLLLERGFAPALRPDLQGAVAVFEALEARLEGDARSADATQEALTAVRLRTSAVRRKLAALGDGGGGPGAGDEEDGGDGAELVLEFRTPEARDEAFRTLHANAGGVTGAALLDLVRAYSADAAPHGGGEEGKGKGGVVVKQVGASSSSSSSSS
jgi:TPR repeat protein